MRIFVDYKTVVLGLIMVAVAWAAPSFSNERTRIGLVELGAVVRLAVPSGTVLNALTIELDGLVLEDGIGRAGSAVLIKIPDDLSGIYHQIVAYKDEGLSRRIIGIWDFETETGDWSTTGTVATEVGVRTAQGRSDRYAGGSGRFGFNNDDGRTRGVLAFSVPDGASGFDDVTLSTWYLEHRMALAGQEALLRFGDHSFQASSRLVGTTARRGVSLQLSGASGNHDSAVFAIQASSDRDLQSILGVTSEDYLFGFHSNIKPLDGRNFTVAVSGITGHTPTLADSTEGDVSGAGIAFLAPLSDYVDLHAQFDQSQAGDASGQFWSASGDFSLLPNAQDRLLILSAGYEAMDETFFSPLTSSDTQGQEIYRLALENYTFDWQWSLEGTFAETNFNGPSNAPVDTISKLTFDGSYVPEVDHGVWKNASMSFGLSGAQQRRKLTPDEAIGPQDHDIWTAYIGFDRIRTHHSLAIQYSFDWFDDKVNGATSERIHKLETYYSRELSPALEASVTFKIENTATQTETYWSRTGTADFSFDLKPDVWTMRADVNVMDFDDPSLDDGAAFGLEVEWQAFEAHSIVLRADYGSAGLLPDLATTDGWQIGIALQSNITLF
jgi:hypothetical protein